MSEKKTIRMVKKGKGTRPTAKPKIKSVVEAPRTLVGTVTHWVSEFQQKRRTKLPTR